MNTNDVRGAGWTYPNFRAARPSSEVGSPTTTGVVSTWPGWYHICGVTNGNGGAGYIYVNGNQDAAGIQTGVTADTTNTIEVGIRTNNNNNRYWNGKIDDVRIYNYALTPKQIVSIMNAGHPAVGYPVGSAVGYWKFDEGYGTTAKNSGSGGTALNGIPTNMDSPATYGSGWTNNGKFGKALNFDGNDDYLDTRYNAAMDTPSMTLSTWFTLKSEIDCDANNNWRSLALAGTAFATTTTSWDVLPTRISISLVRPECAAIPPEPTCSVGSHRAQRRTRERDVRET